MLRAEQVGKVYRHERVLHRVNLEIREGEVLGLVGESGCGKSTLARLLCCYEWPSSGRVLWNGQDTLEASTKARRQFHCDCQMILQDNLASFDPTMRMEQTLLEAMRYNRMCSQAQCRAEIKTMLTRLRLSQELLKKRPGELSGGERQRMNIGRALLVQPKLLICDEITSSLDVITQYDLLQLLKQIKEEGSLSMLFISHDIHAVKRMSDRILIMHKGEIVEELRKTDGFAYSEPDTRHLFEALPINHPRKRENLARHFADALFSDEHELVGERNERGHTIWRQEEKHQ